MRALLAFAPTDEAFMPGGSPLQLTDVDYMVVEGTHDVDQANTYQARAAGCSILYPRFLRQVIRQKQA